MGTCLWAEQTPSPVLVITINEPGAHALQIIDPRTARIVGSVPIPGSRYAHEVAVSGDGRFAYVTNDAEAVLTYFQNKYGQDWRVVYTDSEGEQFMLSWGYYAIEYTKWDGLDWYLLKKA